MFCLQVESKEKMWKLLLKLVINKPVKHIYYNPPKPEPYYLPTGSKAAPKPDEDQSRTTVYQYSLKGASNSFKKSSIGGSSHHPIRCPPLNEDLMFESRFESGNLYKAIKISDTHYELHIRTDLYTQSHIQWFYFRVMNMKKDVTYRFSIVNLRKNDSLYRKGLKPLLYSETDAQLHGIGWTRCGNDINYFSNRNSKIINKLTTCTLTFTLEFPHENDVVYLAYCYPYTYSDLQKYLVEISENPVKSIYTTVGLLCKTLAGNNLYYVTITAPQDPNETKKKRAVIITARVHPSETPSSWMMKGFIDFLTSQSASAKELREEFIFILVPMLNPDGVIVGNTRCSLTGTDLNRTYRTASRYAHPSIFYTLLLIRRTLAEFDVAMYCDLHAHSEKHNMFIFGCEDHSDGSLSGQVFPFMLYENAADRFSFGNCYFGIEVTKAATARAAMWKMGITHSYTMEASIAGTLLGARRGTHFAVKDYEIMASKFCRTLLEYYNDEIRTPLDCYGTNSRITSLSSLEITDASTPSEESELNMKDLEQFSQSSKDNHYDDESSDEKRDTDGNGLRKVYINENESNAKDFRMIVQTFPIITCGDVFTEVQKNEPTGDRSCNYVYKDAEENETHVIDLEMASQTLPTIIIYDDVRTQTEESELNMKGLETFSQTSKDNHDDDSTDSADSTDTTQKTQIEMPVNGLREVNQSTYLDAEKRKSNVDFGVVSQTSPIISTEVQENKPSGGWSSVNFYIDVEENETHVEKTGMTSQTLPTIYEVVSKEVEGNELLAEIRLNVYEDVEENDSNVKNSAKFSQIHTTEEEENELVVKEESETSVENSETNAKDLGFRNCYEGSTKNSTEVSRNVYDSYSVYSAAIKQIATVVKDSTMVIQNPKNIDEGLEENDSNVKNSANISQIHTLMYKHASTEEEESEPVVNEESETSVESREANAKDLGFTNCSAAIKQSAIVVKNSTTVIQNPKNIDKDLEESKSNVKDLAKADMSSRNIYDDYPTQVEESESVVKEESASNMKCLRKISQCSRGTYENVSIAAEEIGTAAKKLTRIVKRLKITYEDVEKSKSKDFGKVDQNSGSTSKNISTKVEETGTVMINLRQVSQKLKNIYKGVEKTKRTLKDLGQSSRNSSDDYSTQAEESEPVVKEESATNMKFLGNISQSSRGTYENASKATEEIKAAAKELKNIVQSLKVIYKNIEKSKPKDFGKVGQNSGSISKIVSTKVEESGTVMINLTQVKQKLKNIYKGVEKSERNLKDLGQSSRNSSDDYSIQVGESEPVVKHSTKVITSSKNSYENLEESEINLKEESASNERAAKNSTQIGEKSKPNVESLEKADQSATSISKPLSTKNVEKSDSFIRDSINVTHSIADLEKSELNVMYLKILDQMCRNISKTVSTKMRKSPKNEKFSRKVRHRSRNIYQKVSTQGKESVVAQTEQSPKNICDGEKSEINLKDLDHSSRNSSDDYSLQIGESDPVVKDSTKVIKSSKNSYENLEESEINLKEESASNERTAKNSTKIGEKSKPNVESLGKADQSARSISKPPSTQKVEKSDPFIRDSINGTHSIADLEKSELNVIYLKILDQMCRNISKTVSTKMRKSPKNEKFSRKVRHRSRNIYQKVSTQGIESVVAITNSAQTEQSPKNICDGEKSERNLKDLDQTSRNSSDDYSPQVGESAPVVKDSTKVIKSSKNIYEDLEESEKNSKEESASNEGTAKNSAKIGESSKNIYKDVEKSLRKAVQSSRSISKPVSTTKVEKSDSFIRDSVNITHSIADLEKSELNVIYLKNVDEISKNISKNVSTKVRKSSKNVQFSRNVTQRFINIYKNDSTKGNESEAGQRPKNIWDVEKTEPNVKLFQEFKQICMNVHEDALKCIKEGELDLKNSIQVGQSPKNIHNVERNMKLLQKLSHLCKNMNRIALEDMEKTESVVKDPTDVRKRSKHVSEDVKETDFNVLFSRTVTQRSKNVNGNASIKVEESGILLKNSRKCSHIPRNFYKDVSRDVKESVIKNSRKFSQIPSYNQSGRVKNALLNIYNALLENLQRTKTVINNSKKFKNICDNFSTEVEENETDLGKVSRSSKGFYDDSAQVNENETNVEDSGKV